MRHSLIFLRIQDPDLLKIIPRGGDHGIEVHQPILVELLYLNLVSRGHLVVEPKHLARQGVASVALFIDAVHPGLYLLHHVEAVTTVTCLLLSRLSIVNLAKSSMAAVSLFHLALLIRRNLDEVILNGGALLLLTLWCASLRLILLLLLILLHVTAVSLDEVGIERVKILQR